MATRGTGGMDDTPSPGLAALLGTERLGDGEQVGRASAE